MGLSASLAPGEFRYVDADTPASTSQINLQFTVSSVTAPIRVRQIDPSCGPASADSCSTLSESNLAARPAGVTSFGSTLSVIGTRTRIVIQNVSADETITLSVTVQPHRAGCT